MTSAGVAVSAAALTLESLALAVPANSSDMADRTADAIAAIEAVEGDQDAELAAVQQQGARLEQQRLDKLKADGLSDEAAQAQLLKEQKASARETRHTIMELTLDGLTPQQIADQVPGLALVDGGETDVGVASNPSDVSLDRGRIYSEPHCACDIVTTDWMSHADLEDGTDVVGMRVTENVQQLGGSVRSCDWGTEPDTCWTLETNWENSNGVARQLTSEHAEYGTISMSVKAYSDGPGHCQMFSKYDHAWLSPRLTGVSIGLCNIGVTWSNDDGQWEMRQSGPGIAC